jgi:hypothetical protein
MAVASREQQSPRQADQRSANHKTAVRMPVSIAHHRRDHCANRALAELMIDGESLGLIAAAINAGHQCVATLQAGR